MVHTPNPRFNPCTKLMLDLRTAVCLLLLGLAVGLIPLTAFAEDPEETEAENPALSSILDGIDDAVGAVNGLVAPVMFFDLYPFDNTISLEQVQKTPRKDGRVFVESTTDKGETTLKFAKEVVYTNPLLVLDTPVTRKFGEIEAQVRTEERGGVRKLVAAASAQTLAPNVKLPDPPPTEGGAIALVTLDGPIPVQVNPQVRRTLPVKIELKPGDILPVAGDTIDVKGEDRTVVRMDGDKAIVFEDIIEEAGPFANPDDLKLPAVVVWLVLGALFFTFSMKFISIRALPHALSVLTGSWDDPDDEGEISHFQALSSALSATVGLGNIAGVAVAVSMGGPGAIFWMVMAGFLGMSSKFVECTLGQMYRVKLRDGSVSGGPMHYLADGLDEMGIGFLGKGLAVMFAVMCVGGSLGGGNMFQANQSFQALFATGVQAGLVGSESEALMSVVYGVLLAVLVGLVTLGGIKRIGMAAGAIVPLMCGLYLLAGAAVLIMNAAQLPSAMMLIIRSAFSPESVSGGMVGVLMIGFQRAAFSNEAGVGSASIAHSAASTAYPVREGIVALLEPFVDTIIVCTMTGLVVVVTGAHLDASSGSGIIMTQNAFGTVVTWFPTLLSVAVVLFAFSTMISWSYYGERCSVFLFGENARLPYRIVFLFFVVVGSVIKLGNVIDFSDLMILGMAFPNILGAVLLSGKVRSATQDYMKGVREGIIRQPKKRS